MIIERAEPSKSISTGLLLEDALYEKAVWKSWKIKDFNLTNIHFVWQKEMNGLGDAISYARNHVGNEPFAVLLGDTLVLRK